MRCILSIILFLSLSVCYFGNFINSTTLFVFAAIVAIVSFLVSPLRKDLPKIDKKTAVILIVALALLIVIAIVFIIQKAPLKLSGEDDEFSAHTNHSLQQETSPVKTNAVLNENTMAIEFKRKALNSLLEKKIEEAISNFSKASEYEENTKRFSEIIHYLKEKLLLLNDIDINESYSSWQDIYKYFLSEHKSMLEEKYIKRFTREASQKNQLTE